MPIACPSPVGVPRGQVAPHRAEGRAVSCRDARAETAQRDVNAPSLERSESGMTSVTIKDALRHLEEEEHERRLRDYTHIFTNGEARQQYLEYRRKLAARMRHHRERLE